MMIFLPIYEHGICFHLSVSSSISFFSVVQFSKYRSFTSLVKFIPRYFIFLVAIVSGTFSLVSLSDSSLLVYKNAVATSLAQVQHTEHTEVGVGARTQILGWEMATTGTRTCDGVASGQQRAAASWCRLTRADCYTFRSFVSWLRNTAIIKH